MQRFSALRPVRLLSIDTELISGELKQDFDGRVKFNSSRFENYDVLNDKNPYFKLTVCILILSIVVKNIIFVFKNSLVFLQIILVKVFILD